jgi:hypothetical protein
MSCAELDRVPAPLRGPRTWTAASGIARAVPTTKSRLLDTVLRDLSRVGLAWIPGFASEGSIGALPERLLRFGRGLGLLATQNVRGDLLVRVTATQPSGPVASFGHRGHAPMSPHSDSADYVALLCLRPALVGGKTTICSAAALYNEVLERHPRYLGPLCAGFYFDRAGKTCTEPGVSDRRIPVFRRRGDRFSCTFNRNRIIVGMAKAGIPLSAIESDAIDYLDSIAKSDVFRIDLDLRRGDVLILNNHITLHGRGEFRDSPVDQERRLLLRLWINQPTLWNSWAHAPSE